MNAANVVKGLPKARKSGSGWLACCPCHEDHNPSLHVSERDGKILVKCFAGCDQVAVIGTLKNMGLWSAGERREHPPEWGRIVRTYDYTDEDGNSLYQVCRFEPKTFRPRYSDGQGGWIWRKHPTQILYRLREVLEAPIVFLVEGEKDCETLREYGFVATTNAGGANASWLPGYTDALRGREIILIPDNDAPGRQRVVRIAQALLGHAAKLSILQLEGGAKDISEWFAQGHSELELIAQLDGEEVSR